MNIKNKYELRNYLRLLEVATKLNLNFESRITYLLIYKTAPHLYFYNNSNIGINWLEKCNLDGKILKSILLDKKIPFYSNSIYYNLINIKMEEERLSLQEKLLKCYKEIREDQYVKIETSEGKVLYKPLKLADPNTEKINKSMILSDKDIDWLIEMFHELNANNEIIKENLIKLYQHNNTNNEDITKKYEKLKNKIIVHSIELINAEVKDGFINITFSYPVENKEEISNYIRIKDLINNENIYIDCKIKTIEKEVIQECSERRKEISPLITYEIESDRISGYSKTFIIPGLGS